MRFHLLQIASRGPSRLHLTPIPHADSALALPGQKSQTQPHHFLSGHRYAATLSGKRRAVAEETPRRPLRGPVSALAWQAPPTAHLHPGARASTWMPSYPLVRVSLYITLR